MTLPKSINLIKCNPTFAYVTWKKMFEFEEDFITFGIYTFGIYRKEIFGDFETIYLKKLNFK